MKIHVRDGVHETNSSSSHSATIAKGDVFDLDFPQHMLRTGVIRLSPPRDATGEEVDFDTAWRRYHRPENILAYLVIAACGGRIASTVCDVDVLPAFLKRRKRLRDLIEWVTERSGCKVEFVFPTIAGLEDDGSERAVYVGHQSKDQWFGLMKRRDELESLLFNGHSYLETGYDNEQPPYLIPTDLTMEDVTNSEVRYYDKRFTLRDDVDVEVELSFLNGNRLLYVDEDGEIEKSIRSFDLYDVFNGSGPINLHLVSTAMEFEAYVSSWPEGMEEYDTDLGVSPETRAFNLMNSFVGLAIWKSAGNFPSRITVDTEASCDFDLIGKSSNVARMPHDCKRFTVKMRCDAATREILRNNVVGIKTVGVVEPEAHA